MFINPDSGVNAARRGIHGVSSSAWLPIRNELAGKGADSDRQRAGGDNVVVRSDVNRPHSFHDLRERRSNP